MPYVKSECSGVRNFAEKSFGDSAQPEGQSDSPRVRMAEDSIAKITGPSEARHLGVGLADWPDSRRILRGYESWLPFPE